MKIPNKREFQQIGVSHLLDIDFRDFTSLYKKSTAKPYPFLVIDTKESFRKNIKTNYGNWG